MSALLEAEDVVVEYLAGQRVVRALDGVRLTVPKTQERLGIIGESGSGKSTLALTIPRLLPPNARRIAGDLKIDGRSIFAYSQAELRAFRRDELGFVFQNPMTVLDPTRRVGKQLASVLDKRRSDQSVIFHFQRVGLRQAALVSRRYPHELSGGMAQRVAIAIAIARKPRLIIADEPTSALDSSIREEILELLFSLPAETGASLLFFSHDLRAVAKHCDRVAVMYAGRIIELGSGETVFSRPAHPYTEALLTSAPGAEGPGGRLEPIPGLPPTLSKRSESCAFAPRCPWAAAICISVRPEQRIVDGREVLCHRAEEVLDSRLRVAHQ